MNLTRTEQMLLQAIKAALCGTQVDWKDESPQELDGLMRLALQHKLQPLALQAVYDCPAAKAWPKLEENRQRAKAQVVAQAAKTEEFLSLYQAFRDAGCFPLIVKGILCRELYPNGDLRQSGDEDLFAAPQQFSACCKVLRENGFVPLGQADEETQDEISWKKSRSLLCIELHRNLFPQSRKAVKAMQSFFENAFDAPQTYPLKGGAAVGSMSAHDHFLYLLLHAYKHFIRGGFGIRQVCDIGLWAKKYNAAIDWDKLLSQAEQTNTVKFTTAIFRIAQRSLGIEFSLPQCWQQTEVDEQPMLKDLLCAGIYGNSDRDRQHSAAITQNAVSARQTKHGGTLLHAAFPPKKELEQDYPVLQKHGVLLPVCWVRRLASYRKELRQNRSTGVSRTLKLANERKKLLKFYDIL